MTKTETLLRAAAELESMPQGMSSEARSKWVLQSDHVKSLTVEEFQIASKLVLIAGVLAND